MNQGEIDRLTWGLRRVQSMINLESISDRLGVDPGSIMGRFGDDSGIDSENMLDRASPPPTLSSQNPHHPRTQHPQGEGGGAEPRGVGADRPADPANRSFCVVRAFGLVQRAPSACRAAERGAAHSPRAGRGRPRQSGAVRSDRRPHKRTDGRSWNLGIGRMGSRAVGRSVG